MTDTTTGIKHVASALARQTLQNNELTRPVAGVKPRLPTPVPVVSR